MTWMQKLYETYERCSSNENLQSVIPLAPLAHVIQQAHIEIALDAHGKFKRARAIDKEYTVIPATEKSATSRTSAIVPHPLCDHIKYCAADYKENSEKSNKHFDAYLTQLKAWCKSPYSHPKATAVLHYVEKGTVVSDLKREKVLPIDDDGHILTQWKLKKDKPLLFRQLTADKGTYKPQNALIRWVVEMNSDLVPEVWKDKTIQNAWIAYTSQSSATPGLCMVTGVECVLADKHPRGMRGGKDGAKLISNKKESESDFVYLGRFLNSNQAVGVGRDVTQKAHSVLRWLIARQGYRNGDQAIVAWSVVGKNIPDWWQDSNSLFLSAEEIAKQQTGGSKNIPYLYGDDVGQAYARQLNQVIRGYGIKLTSSDNIVVMAFDSASKGRLAITFYRELTGSEFLERIQAWHQVFAWHQDYGYDSKKKSLIRFVGAPSPEDIAEAAHGRPKDKQHEKHIKATMERLLPCIVDGRQLPRDLMESTFRRTCNRASFEKSKQGREWEWEKNLGIACALFKGLYTNQEAYQMTLEIDRTSRDYLYGRLLAIAENIESFALTNAEKNRDTAAAKLMQRFSDRPFSTWKNIELGLTPYKSRLRSSDRNAGFLRRREELLDEVHCKFQEDDFINDRPLSGEFLLGYHCQRQNLYKPSKTDNPGSDSKTTDNDIDHKESMI